MNWRPNRPDFESIHQSDPYVQNISHPRLFFSSEDIPELREQAQRIKGFVERLLVRAEGHLEVPPPTSENLHTGMGQAIGRLSDLGAAYVLTGEAQYAEGVKTTLDQTFDLDPWIYPVHQPTEFDHGSANGSAAVAIAIDFLGAFIGAEERRAFKRRLVAKTAETFRRVYANRSERWVTSMFNWRSMCCSDMGLALLTVMEVYPNFAEAMGYALDGVLAILDVAPQDGEWGEGLGYWGAALGLPLRFALALDRITDGTLDLFRHPYLRVTGDFLLHGTGPNGRVFDFADCGPTLGSRHYALLGLLGKRLDKPHWRKMALRHPPTDLFELVCTSGVEDPGEVPDPPKAMHFREYGIVTLRSGWKEDDAFVALKAGPTVVGHAHLDIASFMVTAFGETLIPDLGTWPYAHYLGFFDRERRRWDFDANGTLGHNVVLVDGGGQQYGEDHYGEIVKFEPGERTDLVIVDATKTYAPLLDRFIRWFVFVKPDLLVIFDELRAESPRKFEWLLHYEGQVAEADKQRPSASDLSVTQGKAGFDLNFLLPSREEGWIAGRHARRTTYRNSNTGQLVELENRYALFSRLHGTPEERFLAVLSLYPREERERFLWNPELEKAEEQVVAFRARRQRETLNITLKLDTREAKVVVSAP